MFLILFVLVLEGGAHGNPANGTLGGLNAACCSLTVELAYCSQDYSHAIIQYAKSTETPMGTYNV
jgi:hypothetical protein